MAYANVTTYQAVASTSTTILAANSTRTGAAFYNESTATLFLKLGSSVSSTSTAAAYTVQVAPGGYYELPSAYNGVVDGLWSAANGSVRITELV